MRPLQHSVHALHAHEKRRHGCCTVHCHRAIMRTKALINHFHDVQPISSAHFGPGGKGRLATAGGDSNVRVLPPPPLSPPCPPLCAPVLTMLDASADLANTRFTR